MTSTTRANIIELIHSEDDESLKQLHALLAEAVNNPTVKLSSKTGTIQTKTIKVPSKWISPPNFSTSSSDGILPSSKSKVPTMNPGSSASQVQSLRKSSSIKMASSSLNSKLATSSDSLNNSSNRPSQPRASKSVANAVVSAAVAGSEDGTFCICGSLDDNDEETFIKCSIGKGGCNGWIHLSCSDLTETQKDDIILNKQKQQPKYVCSLCKEYVKNNKKGKNISLKKSIDDGDDEYEPPLESTSPIHERKRGSIGATRTSSKDSLMKKIKSSK